MSALLSMNPVQAILAQTSLQNTLFASNSRYYGLETATLERPGKLPVVYLRRRFLPDAASFQVVEQHTVMADERPDLVAAQFLGDATLFWRLCDANNAMRPEEITETVGGKINITLPEGISGTAL
jgi:hypothetical protein